MIRFIGFSTILFCFFLAGIDTPRCLESSIQVANQDPAKEQVLSQGDLQTIYSEIIHSDISWEHGDIKISSFSSQPQEIYLPDGEVGYRLLQLTPDRYPGKKYVSIILTVNGTDAAKVKMNGDIQFFGDVVCAAKTLPRNTVITEDDITTVYRNISMLDDTSLRDTDQAIGKISKATLQQGDLLFKRMLKKRPLVKRGDLVTIVARHGALQVTTPGEVKNRGAEGDVVKVKNLASRRVIYARVLDEGLVEATTN